MSRLLRLLFPAMLALALPCAYPDTSRGVGTIATADRTELRVGCQYLAIIAINDYQQWMPLRSPVREANEIRKILVTRYKIDEVFELYDDEATKANIIRLFVDLQKRVMADDSLLVYYSGHGHLDESSDTGFWIPANAGTDVYEQQNWLPHAQLKGLIANIASNHVLVISDSCFAGDLIYSTRSLPAPATAEYFEEAYSRVSRQVLTSGAVEAVQDGSSFAEQLISVLTRNGAPLLDALMLYNELRLGVRGSTPLLGSLAGTGHQEGASFLLFLRDELAPGELPPPEKDTPPDVLPLPAEVPADEPADVASEGPRRFSSGLACGALITVGWFGPAFKTEPAPSWRLHYRHLRDWGETILGLRAAALILTGRDGLENPLNPDPWDATSWLLAASFGYATVSDPLLYFAAEVTAGAAINVIRTYSPEIHKTTRTKPHLGAAVGVGLRLLHRLKVSVVGRLDSIFFDEAVFMGITPELSVEYTF
ncbi:MAG: caspase family protein [Spirochaetales bacterium]|nr:caspase family protein [Spirochaetales bacterium]